MAAESQAPCVTKSSPTVSLMMPNKWDLIFTEEVFDYIYRFLVEEQ